MHRRVALELAPVAEARILETPFWRTRGGGSYLTLLVTVLHHDRDAAGRAAGVRAGSRRR